jgi:hypothetical protein
VDEYLPVVVSRTAVFQDEGALYSHSAEQSNTFAFNSPRPVECIERYSGSAFGSVLNTVLLDVRFGRRIA